jgi:hypothetical protein
MYIHMLILHSQYRYLVVLLKTSCVTCRVLRSLYVCKCTVVGQCNWKRQSLLLIHVWRLATLYTMSI